MNHRALTSSFLTAAAIGTALLFAAPASAQETNCREGDLFCAELQIGPGRAGIRIGGGDPVPPPPPVVVQEPQPPVVVVQPAPPPPAVVVQPYQQPQPYVVQQQYAVQQPRPLVAQQPAQPRDRFPQSSTGIRLHLGSAFGDELAMGGGGAAFRIRPNPYFALDIGGAMYGGTDYNGQDRFSAPLTVDAILFFNPQHRFQFYALLGIGASYSHTDGLNRHTGNYDSRDMFHLGGAAGLGVEWRLSRVFALNLDFRGFIQQRVGDDDQPEFTEPLADGSGGWQSTDLSGGGVVRAGMTFYFGR